MDGWLIVYGLLMGFTLAATCGIRAFLPLLIISIAAKIGLINLASGFEWMTSWQAITCFASATVIEILGDKIPAVDHFLDTSGAFVRPVAGALAASSLIVGMDPLLAMVIGIIVGVGIAATVSAIKSSLRLFSTGLTGGLANPAISVVEDSATAVTGIASLFIPGLVAFLVVGGLVAGVIALHQRRKIRRTEPEASGT